MKHDYNWRRKGWKEGAAGVGIDLQMNLLSTWTNHHVSQYYQNIFLAYLDELDRVAAEEAIKKEIKNTLQNKSLFYCMQRLKYERTNILLEIQSHLTQSKNSTEEYLPYICLKVKHLRDLNLHIAQTIIKIFEEFTCVNPETQNRQIKECLVLIDDLQSSIVSIKRSYLKDYLRMGEDFDPFFMNSYEEIHRQSIQNIKQPIKQLFNLSISYVYRLMKAKNRLLDMRSMYKLPTPRKRSSKEIIKLESLPTLQTQYLYDSIDRNQKKRSIATPIRIIRPSSRQKNKRSRTTVYPIFEGRPDSSYTEINSKHRPMIGNLYDQTEGIENNRFVKNKLKKNKVYLITEPNEPKMKYHFNRNDEPLLKQYPESQRQRRWSKNSQDIGQNLSSSTSFAQETKIKNYNPIKGDNFEIVRSPQKRSKYDFNPITNIDRIQYQKTQQLHSEPGLQWESPISKYNKKAKYQSNKLSLNNVLLKAGSQLTKFSHTGHKSKLDQQVQTVQVRSPAKNEKYQRVKKQKPKNNQVADEETVEDEDIIDERPQGTQTIKALIREVGKQREQKAQVPVLKSQEKNQTSTKRNTNEDKRQVKMKAGKASIQQILTALQKSTILPSYRKLFDLQKLAQWIKSSQTYLTQFYINDTCVIMALCSPIPNIGIAVKLWAPISEKITQAMSMNLFAKYIQFIEKSTTSQKIMYSGNGDEFKELKNCGFILKKENFYERPRSIPPKKSDSEFKPFLYVECSTVNFLQNGNQIVIFSQQIEEFRQGNCDLATFLGSIQSNKIPENLKSLIRINQKAADFNEVNKILASESFDQYEASQLKITNIKLLRLFLNSPFKSGFLAEDGYLKLAGNLLYEKDQKMLIVVNTTQHNGLLLFSKNLSFNQIRQISKLTSTNKTAFSVKMFSKKLYGKLAKFAPGCYGNFQIDLAYQDQIQGRIRHNLRLQKCFGPEPFTIGLIIQKHYLFSITIGEDDFIY